MYHHVAPTDNVVNVRPELFEDQLRAMHKKGWRALSGEEFLYFLRNKNEKPKKCVLLTFDDGFADNYVIAMPLLKKYGMKAVLFVATDLIADGHVNRGSFVPLAHNDAWNLAHTERRSEVMCTWTELKEMEDSGLFDIQSHGMSHKTHEYIKEGNYPALKEDLSGGRAVLEKRLSKRIAHFAWPKGIHDEKGREIAAEAGYEALYTTDRGANTAENLDVINRLPVKKNGEWLMAKLPVYSSVLLSKIYLTVRAGK